MKKVNLIWFQSYLLDALPVARVISEEFPSMKENSTNLPKDQNLSPLESNVQKLSVQSVPSTQKPSTQMPFAQMPSAQIPSENIDLHPIYFKWFRL